MTNTTHLKPAYFGAEVELVQNASGNPLYKKLALNWSKPQVLDSKPNPFFEENRPLLYALTRDHHRKQTKNEIVYIGLSMNPSNRFHNHPTARELAERRGETGLSYAYLDLEKSSSRLPTVKRALEEVEHILIWALWPTLHNEKKQFTLPGMGTKPGEAWHIVNTGFRFSGLMPREIIYPWMLILPGRDRSIKSKTT